MVVRAATANTGGPLIASLSVRAARGRQRRSAAANERRSTASAASWASVSEPARRVCATSSARAPSAEVHTPPLLCGDGIRIERVDDGAHLAGRIAREQRFQQQHLRAEVSASSESPIAACRPATVKRSARTCGAQQIAVLEEKRAHRARAAAASPLLTLMKAGSARRQRRERARHLRARGGIGAFDGGDDEARRRSLAQLLHQQALRRARRARQKGRQIGGVGRARRDARRRPAPARPTTSAARRAARHGPMCGPERHERSVAVALEDLHRCG